MRDFSVRLLKTAGAGDMMRVRLDALNVPIKEHSFPFVIIQVDCIICKAPVK